MHKSRIRTEFDFRKMPRFIFSTLARINTTTKKCSNIPFVLLVAADIKVTRQLAAARAASDLLLEQSSLSLLAQARPAILSNNGTMEPWRYLKISSSQDCFPSWSA